MDDRGNIAVCSALCLLPSHVFQGSESMTHLLRSWMFAPAHRQKMVDKSMGLELDAAILDLEDGTPLDEKVAARGLLKEAIKGPAGGPQRYVRVNTLASGLQADDVDAVAGPGLNGIVLPKVESPKDLAPVADALDQIERTSGLPECSTRLVAMIESPAAVLRAAEIASASHRLVALMFGGEDYALEMGMFSVMGAGGSDQAYARSAVAVAAASRGLVAIDRIFVDFRDPDGLRSDALKGRELGMSGKSLIHPDQIPVVHDVFSPSAEDTAFAREVVEAYDAAGADHTGPIAVNGRMVDAPVIERARRVLSMVGK